MTSSAAQADLMNQVNDSRRDIVLSDLAAIAQPRGVLADSPQNDRWLVLPYEGPSISGTMLWSPARNQAKDIEIPLPAIGPCRIHIGMHGSVTWPWWFNLVGVYGHHSRWMRARVRLSDQRGFEDILTRYDNSLQHLAHLTEVHFADADLQGQSLIFTPPSTKPGYLDTCSLISHIRLESIDAIQPWPRKTRTSAFYFDSNLYGHYMRDADEIRGLLRPLQNSDYSTLLWCSSREDSCYYPTNVGNVLPRDATPGIYPYWAGDDLHHMLDQGQDPLQEVCNTGREIGLKVFASYRRMTRRMPPFIFPLHPDAMFEKHPEYRCVDAQGQPVPHLSLTHAPVRKMMIDILAEQASRYDIHGVHLYFSRGLPLVFYEEAVLDEGRRRFDVDLRDLPVTDERLGQARQPFVTTFFRELRAALDVVGQKRSRRFAIAMHTPNSLSNCLYYGIDIALLARENLLDMHLPDRAHYLPESRGVKEVSPESVREIIDATQGSNMRVVPTILASQDMPAIAKALYDAGAAGVHPGSQDVHQMRWEWAKVARLGHRDELDDLEKYAKQAHRHVMINTVAGLQLDHESGVPTCG